MKKRILSLLLVAVLGVSLCACNGPATNDPSGDSGNVGSESGGENNPMLFEVPEGGYDGSEVTISFHHTLSSRYWSLLDTYIAEFNKLYPNIHVEHQLVGDYEDIYESTMKIGLEKGPNVVYCDLENVANYRLKEYVVALDNLIKHPEVGYSQDQLNDFVDAFYNQGKEYGDGYMYSLPVNKKAEVLYYNKTFFDQHQLKVPTTWAEMEVVCEQIKAIDPQSTPLGYESASNWFVTMSQQLGTDYASATEENQAFVKDAQEWYTKGYVLTSNLEDSTSANWQFVNPGAGQCYMVIATSAGAKYFLPTTQGDGTYPFEVGVTKVPQSNANNPKIYSEGPNVCILQKENPQEVMASWLFVKFLTTNKEFQAELSMKSELMPVLKSVANEPNYAEYLAGANNADGIQMLVMKLCMEQQEAYFALPGLTNSNTVCSKMGELLEEAMRTNGDVKSLFGKAMNEIKP